MSISEIVNRGLLYLGKRAIIKEGKNRYKIYLPMDFNDLWEELNKNKAKAMIFVKLEE